MLLDSLVIKIPERFNETAPSIYFFLLNFRLIHVYLSFVAIDSYLCGLGNNTAFCYQDPFLCNIFPLNGQGKSRGVKKKIT